LPAIVESPEIVQRTVRKLGVRMIRRRGPTTASKHAVKDMLDLLFSALGEPLLHRPGSDLRPRGETELVQDIADVGFNGAFAYDQDIGDRAVRHALGDVGSDLALPCRQSAEFFLSLFSTV
jgi:hypothetical protein